MMTQAAGWAHATSSARVATKRHAIKLIQESVAVKARKRTPRVPEIQSIWSRTGF
jgi:hypothetical protein